MSFSRKGLGFQRKPPERLQGEAPLLGHVARLHKNALKLGARLSYAGNVPLILLALGLFLFGAGITAAVLWVSGASARKGSLTLDLPPAVRPMPALRKVAVPEPAELEKTVASFLAARSPAQLEPIVRDTTRDPAALAARLAGIESLDGKVSDVKYRGPAESRCLQLEMVVVKFDSGRNRIALLAPDPTGHWRVDFDAFDRHVSPAWPELLSGKPGDGIARVYACRDNYFNGPYQDDRRWACYGLASPDHETLMFGYVPRGSPQHLAMAESMRLNLQKSSKGLQRMTLEIRQTGAGNRRQFEITRVLADEWAVGDEPLDARAHLANGSATD